jgi:hypothetical protein
MCKTTGILYLGTRPLSPVQRILYPQEKGAPSDRLVANMFADWTISTCSISRNPFRDVLLVRMVYLQGFHIEAGISNLNPCCMQHARVRCKLRRMNSSVHPSCAVHRLHYIQLQLTFSCPSSFPSLQAWAFVLNLVASPIKITWWTKIGWTVWTRNPSNFTQPLTWKLKSQHVQIWAKERFVFSATRSILECWLQITEVWVWYLQVMSCSLVPSYRVKQIFTFKIQVQWGCILCGLYEFEIVQFKKNKDSTYVQSYK